MLTLAILPSLILFYIVWKGDRYEKEPPKLLWKLFGFGALTTVSAALIEVLFENVILASMDQQGMLFLLIDNFLIVALSEEAGKYFVLKKITWKHPAFNYTFDAVVYAVAVSLGFATLENILYIAESGIGVAIIRALFSVPGHVIDAIYMGYYFGTAKYAEAYNDMKMRDKNLKRAFYVPVLIHGFYDFCLSTEHWAFILIFFVFEIIITIITARKFIRLSRVEATIPQEPS
ncbi:MAG: PrsW family intramembrane metalloprotease [Lachnospiraceae bacterium]|nr:PrsW family intramembrane metalloprotease [Lachnospiraceae bacterium]